MSGWVYILGEASGEDIKIGRTGRRDLRERLRQVNQEQTTSCSYRILAGVRGTATAEKALQRHFSSALRTDKGSKREYFKPTHELVEYANWLRSQYWTSLDGAELLEELPMEAPEHWLPDGNGRSVKRPTADPERLVQNFDALDGPLAGTAWAWMVDKKAGVQDYFTPPEIIGAARAAMGGIDLDAASHWIANREHQIPDWFHTGRSAFENDWHGKVWLNPPYGDNGPWFQRILHFWSIGEIEQLCMISPAWAFTTKLAKRFMSQVSGTVLLVPTPKFWGNQDPSRTGRNDPHMVVYLGDRRQEFFRAFSPLGIPFQAAWDELPEFGDEAA